MEEKKHDEVWDAGSLKVAEADPEFGPHVTVLLRTTPNHTFYRKLDGQWVITGYRKNHPENVDAAKCETCSTPYDTSYGAKCPIC